MCGIAGILKVWTPDQRDLALRTPHTQSIPEAWLDILDDSIKHRGPDGHGRFRDRALRADGCIVDVALVHRRLSIIDHAGGHQPMLSLGRGQGVVTNSKRLVLGEGLGLYERDAASELVGSGLSFAPSGGSQGGSAPLHQQTSGTQLASNDRITVIFNGCIYNHRELRAELQRAGHVFSTDHSDTEVLVHGWREWGSQMFNHLDGMWSWILWDAASARLFFSRDPAGEKPLHVSPSPHRESGIAILASTPAALWRLRAAMGGEIDRPSVTSLLSWGYEEPAAGQSIQPVSPCCVCVFDEHSGLIHQDYPAGRIDWENDLRLRAKGKTPTPELIDTMLLECVALQSRADVPVGFFLSGGIDSALVAAHAKRALGSIRTFTVRMPDSRYDESAAAETTSRALRTQHSTIDCNPSPASDLQALITQLGAPLGDSSLLPTHWVCRAVVDAGIRVALGGDGGDELFGGYDRYRAAGWLRRYSILLSQLPAGDGASHPKSPRSRLARLARAARSSGYPDLLRIFSVDDVMRLCSSNDRLTLGVHDWIPTDDPRLYDFQHYLPYDLCAKVDTASMSRALETHAPMLSRDVTAITLGNPLSAVMPRGQRKGLLRAVARKYLPAEIVDRPKMGFAIPIGEWFRTDYGGLRTMLLDHLNSTEPFGPPSLGIDLNMKFIRQMLDDHLGTGPSGIVKRDHSQRLYMLLVLSIWAKWVGSLR